MVKVFFVIFLTIITITTGWKSRRYVKSGPLWLADFKGVFSPNLNKNMRPIQRPKESTSFLNIDTFNIVIPSKQERKIKIEKENFSKKNLNILRICSIKDGCGKKAKQKNNNLDSDNNSKKKAHKELYQKTIQALQDVLNAEDDSSQSECSCPETEKRTNCNCVGLRSKPDSKKLNSCNCSAFDYTCKLKCQQREEATAALKPKRCGCGRNDNTCLEKCFSKDKTEQSRISKCACSQTDRFCQEKCLHQVGSRNQEFLQCGCSKTDRMCQEKCVNRNYLSLRNFLRCGCGNTDRMCQNRCLNREDSPLRSFLQCGCAKTDYLCQDKCLNPDYSVLQSFLRCGCGNTDRMCQNRCLNREDSPLRSILQCVCAKTDHLCQDKCLKHDYSVLQSFLRCGCGNTDRMCQNRCLNREDSPLRSFVQCWCAKTDHLCQDSCLNHDVLQSFLQCGCGKIDRICQDKCFDKTGTATKLFTKCGCSKTDTVCQEICLQSDLSEIQNHLRCGCNVTEFSCLDRCARDGILEHDSAFLNCGCSLNDYACWVRCNRTVHSWRKPNNRICKCANYDRNCKERCSRGKKEKDALDSLIAHVANNGKRYKINSDIDVVVYDPLNLARILDGVQFNSNKIRGNQGQHILPILKFDNNKNKNKDDQPVVKAVTRVEGSDRTNKGRSQEIDQVLKELQDAKMVEFDIGNVQSEHNGKFQSPKPTKFIDMLLEFATKIKNATSVKLSNNLHIKQIANKNPGHYGINGGTNMDGQKIAPNIGNLSLHVLKNEQYPQKKYKDSLGPLYQILRSNPDHNVASRNKTRDDGMDFAKDVIQSLQDYLYARRKGREKRTRNYDHDLNHPHQKHRLLPLTKKQMKKKLNGQVSRSLIKFRRNLPADKVVTYGAPFELDIKGMGQVNFMEAMQLLNV